MRVTWACMITASEERESSIIAIQEQRLDDVFLDHVSRSLQLLGFALAFGGAVQLVAAQPEATDDAAMREAVWADWDVQEVRLERSAGSPESIQAALSRAERLLADLLTTQGVANLESEAAQIEQLVAQSSETSSHHPSDRLGLYRRIRTVTRQLALKNPLIRSHPILFMQRQREVGYMLYEYLGWYYAYGR